MKLFYAPGACSLASHITLEDVGANFEPIKIDFGSSQQQSAEYLAINPKGRVPALVDNGEVITESPAILRYISRRFPEANLWPEGILEDARCAEWLSWCVSSVHVAFSHIGRSCRYAIGESAFREVEAKGRETTRDIWGQVETRLAARKTQWAASDSFSVADPYLFTFWHWGRNPQLNYDMPEDFPVWTEHARRLCERFGVRRALEREGIPLP
jgi:glutathione S-transferase